MKFITYQRFQGQAICGYVNIPAMTEVEEDRGVILYNGLPLCASHSEKGIRHFCRNDDGCGKARGELVMKIQKALGKKSSQPKWDKVWEDDICAKYRRQDYDDHWLWSFDFYQAPIDDLKHIWSLVKS